jgi:hypothetical protein
MNHANLNAIHFLLGYAVFSLVKDCYVLYTSNEEKKERDTIRKELSRRDIADQYTQIRHLETTARSVCKKATQSPCTSAQDLSRFAEIYARSRAKERNTLPASQQGLSFFRRPVAKLLSPEELQQVETFRKEHNTFFTNRYHFGDKTLQPFYPSQGEFESYLTFHWTLTMANNVCAEKDKLTHTYHLGGQPKTYDLMLDALRERDAAASGRVLDVHQIVRQELLPIRRRIFQGEEDTTDKATTDKEKDTTDKEQAATN